MAILHQKIQSLSINCISYIHCVLEGNNSVIESNVALRAITFPCNHKPTRGNLQFPVNLPKSTLWDIEDKIKNTGKTHVVKEECVNSILDSEGGQD